jgi:FAD-linked oxidoreductase
MKIVGGKWSNWSGGVTCKPKKVIAPRDEVELAAAIRLAESTVRAPGAGHSFTPLGGDRRHAWSICRPSRASKRRQGEADCHLRSRHAAMGARAGALRQRVGLKNMGDIDRQTLGGVVGTGTHGTGRTFKGFSGEVAGFRIILASGEVLNCTPTENAEIFAAGRTSMGTLGVMTEITMSVRPAYRLVERNFLLPPDELFRQLDDLVAKNRHFEFFWFPYADHAICKTLNETDEAAPAPRSAEELRKRGEKSSGDMRAFATINEALPYLPAMLKPAHGLFSRLMPVKGKARWSHELFPSPRTIRFNEMEYGVPYANGPDCLREVVETIRKKKINTGFPLEYRSVAADDVWLSPFYRRESATIAVHQYHKVDTTALFTACEAIFRKYEGRPHWGKRHTRTAGEFAALYPEFERFRHCARNSIPPVKFLNAYLKAIFD